jgi:hypothetical protein
MLKLKPAEAKVKLLNLSKYLTTSYTCSYKTNISSNSPQVKGELEKKLGNRYFIFF